VKRFDPSVGSSLMTLGVIVAVGILLSIVTIVPRGGTAVSTSPGGGDSAGVTGDEATAAGGDSGAATGTGPSGGGGASAGVQGSSGTAAAGVVNKAGITCAAGKNGGNTDVGVTGGSVKLAATIVADGPGSSFLGAVRTGMTTVLNKVNKTGGICGRHLDLILRNDSWEANRGQQYIKNFVEGDKVFALAVVPSSEGLNASDEYIKQQKVPVVGTDGMLKRQYLNPWIWPVATSTISVMHVMAQDAHDRGAQAFGLVFDAKYHFGVEGAYAFDQAVKRLTGKDIDGFDSQLKSCKLRFCGIQPSKPSYATEASSFSDACYKTAPACDFIALLLEPDTALSFQRETPASTPRLGFGGAQPLFTRDFAEGCKALCDGMSVWTGYNPPIEALASRPAVAKYVNEVHAEAPSADVANQFLEGGYLGFNLLVDALQKVGPNVTRNNLKTVLDSMSYDTGLSSPLSWKAGNHFANTSAQAFEIQYKQSFNGWRQRTGFLKDPWVGQDLQGGD
jgi:ABC-type branched-subunit amino acid transport system substrate-binding protein